MFVCGLSITPIAHFLWGGNKMNVSRVLLAVLTVVLLTTGVLTSENSAFAQAVITVAQLNGTVRDSTGSVVANANVRLRSVDTNRTYT